MKTALNDPQIYCCRPNGKIINADIGHADSWMNLFSHADWLILPHDRKANRLF